MGKLVTIPDQLYERAAKQAQMRGQDIDDFVAAAVASQVEATAETASAPQRRFPTRTYDMGKPKVDINDREELYRAMDGR